MPTISFINEMMHSMTLGSSLYLTVITNISSCGSSPFYILPKYVNQSVTIPPHFHKPNFNILVFFYDNHYMVMCCAIKLQVSSLQLMNDYYSNLLSRRHRKTRTKFHQHSMHSCFAFKLNEMDTESKWQPIKIIFTWEQINIGWAIVTTVYFNHIYISVILKSHLN